MAKLKSVKEFEKLHKQLTGKKNPKKPSIAVCAGTGCVALGATGVVDAFKKEIKRMKLSEKVELLITGCHGFCERGVVVLLRPEGILYQRVKPADVPEILEKTILNNEIIERLLYEDTVTGKKIVHEKDIPFYKHQDRLIFGSNNQINPTSIDDYISIGGYSALARVLSDMKPEAVVDVINKSGLRGRGGGGFPTGKKWEYCRRAEGDIKYVIINADEGDPGAYMDRSILEGNPHSVLEGLIIGAYAVESTEGYIYVRQEYPLALEHFTTALDAARKYGFLGKNILGSGMNFDVKIARGGGAFVCGESTALMASIEGRVGEPRAKHFHTVERGLHESPTVLNNVETWANVPVIINKGWEWFSEIGTDRSKGTKIFSLVGKVNNTGLVEVPMGTTLRQIIFDIGGGIQNNKKFKAVQTGGPSGGVVPESLLDLPVDFERLTEAGSMMGSGGMIVMDENNCMVDVAKYFVDFLKDESCGKCTPCREGLIQMSEILKDITEGNGKEGDLELLEELSWVMTETSLCALGASAAFPFLSTLRYFRDEYEVHIKEKRCPAHVCKALITYTINAKKCTGCTLCALKCPQDAISGEKKALHEIDQSKCIKCGICVDACKFDAVIVD
ncbi:4Fe-4S binding protein [bacterium]|nr:4Fe-4S binding protein [bacterium]